MKKIIFKESQFDKLIINEMHLNGFDWKTLSQYIKMGYLVHGSNEDFEKFDTSRINGGVRAEYGYGMYFTNEPYKALEYGQEIYLTKMNLYKFFDLESNDISAFDEIEKNINELSKAKYELYNAVNVRDYEYYDDLVKKLTFKTRIGDYEDVVYNEFSKRLKKGGYKNLEDVFKSVRMNLPTHFDKYISSFFRKIGYDGIKCGNQFVIFNFELLNNNLLKEIVE